MTIPIIVPHYGSEKIAITFIKNFFKYSNKNFILHFGWNDPNKKIPQSIKLLKSRNLELYHVRKPGSYSVRNFIIKKIYEKNDYIVFTDSDCILNAKYFHQLSSIIKTKPKGIVVGDVKLFKPSDHSNFVYNYEIILEWNIERTALKGGGLTANLIIPSFIFKKYGYFDESLMSGGDNLFCKRVNQKCKNSFNKKLIVMHPSRKNIEAMGKKIQRTYMGWFYIFGWHRKSKFFQCLYLIYCFRPPIRPMLRIFKSKKSINLKIQALVMLIILRIYCIRAHIKFLINKYNYQL